MPDPQTTNLGLFAPLNGSNVGVWDAPVNANWNLLDSVIAAPVTVAITNVNITLSAAQYGTATLVLTGTQTADVTLFFPNVGKMINVVNLCTNNTTFVVGLQTAALGQMICAPPGQMISAYSDGTNFQYVNLSTIGTYMDIAAGSVPRWITACTVDPYLDCNGTAFSSATYPALRDFLGSATLPDARGRARFALNQGTGRSNAVPCNTLLGAGGTETIGQANLPNYNLTNSLGVSGLVSISDPGHLHVVPNMLTVAVDNAVGTIGAWNPNPGGQVNTSANFTGISASFSGSITGTIGSGGSGSAYNIPGYCGGLTLIRAG